MNFQEHLRVCVLVCLMITVFSSGSAEGKDKPDRKNEPSFRADLKQFGYVTKAAEYSSIGFLSNDLLLVVINQRVFYAVEPLRTDRPASTFIVFDVAKKQLVYSAQMMVAKSPRSVAVLATGDFSSGNIVRCETVFG